MISQIKTALSALLVFTVAWADPAFPPARPNILVILADDLGYGDLSSYGATDLRTPNIDRLMGQSLRFDRFYANGTVCSPTRASLLTGRYPDLVGVPGVIRQVRTNSWGFLDPAALTLPQVLQTAGFKTGLVGKWHLGLESPNLPNERGFHYFHGFLGDMMDDYRTHLRQGVNFMRENQSPIRPSGHATELFSDWAIDYLSTSVRTASPFFLYLAYNAPHFPIQPPAEWLDRHRAAYPHVGDKRALNAAFIEHLDHHIGRVLRVLDDLNLSENTLVIFSSDNGGALPYAQSNGALRGGKQDHWEGGIRVPTCIRWPGQIPPGRTDELAMTMDLFPTISDAAGISLHHEIDGVSLLPLFRSGESRHLKERPLVWVRREGGERFQGRAYYAVRMGPWKLVQNHPFEAMMLHNLDIDPEELHPVENQPEIKRQLTAQLLRHIQRAGAVPWQN